MPSPGSNSKDPASEEASAPSESPVGGAVAVSWPARFLHLFALNGLAVAQPLLGLLGGEPQFWIARDATYLDVFIIVVLATLVVPLAAFGIERLVALLSRTAAWWFHLVMVFGLGFVFAVHVIDTVTDRSMRVRFILLAAIAVAAALSYAYGRFKGVRDFIGILAIGPFVLVGVLLVGLPPLGGSSGDVVAVGIESDAPVVFVVFDEMQIASILKSDGSIDRTRYPNLGRLADLSTWYRNGTTVHDNTLKSIPTILTGRNPAENLEGTVSDYPQNLFTVLGATHTMRVDENVTQLCPTNLCEDAPQRRSTSDHVSVLITDTAVVYMHAVLPDSLRESLPPIGTRWEGFLEGDVSEDPSEGPELGPQAAELAELTGGAERAVQFGDFLDSFDPELGPALYYLHVDLPHAPWSHVPSGKRYASSDTIPGYATSGEWLDDPWLVQQAYQRYLLHMGIVDELTGRMLDHLERLGMLDDSMIVVVSDHGENFESGESRRGLQQGNLAAIAGIPIFVKYPGKTEGVIDDRNAQAIDVLPTIVDALGGTIDDVDGLSLLGEPRNADKHLFGLAGGEYTISLADYERLVDQQIALNQGLFRTGAGFLPAYEEAGPRPDLYGRSIAGMEIRSIPGSVVITTAHAFEDFDPEGPWVPAWILAEVRSDAAELPSFFAVAVNGTIRATISADEWSLSAAKVYAIVAPYSFVAGDNDVEIFGLPEDPSSNRLLRFS